MWTVDFAGTLPVWRLTKPNNALLAFSTRCGGVSEPPYDSLNLGRSTRDDPSAVAENRRRLLGALEYRLDQVATAGQVHGIEAREVESPGHFAGCDALWTRVPGVVLAITTADCMPILFTAPGVIAAVHSGWRGTAAGMPRVTLEALCTAAEVEPAEVEVHIGPCIRSCCYEVGVEVARSFPSAALVSAGRSTHLDLVEAARLQLVGQGVPPSAITDIGACTACEPERYYSHRRDSGRTGRHWALAALPPRG